MFNKSNFCHIASNNRNEQKGSVFIYKTTDTLAQVTQSGYFNEKLIDINLHDLIIHVQYNQVNRTLKKSVLIVTERTLDNVETAPILDQTIGDDIADLGDQVQGIEEKIPSNASATNQLATASDINTKITNCITEIPQDIQVQTSGDTFTLKARSKVCIPNGNGVFNTITISADISNSAAATDAFVVTNGNILVWTNSVFSGTTAPSAPANGTIWYDTANNLVKRFSTSSGSWVSGFSLPVALFNSQDNSKTKIFNGFGYIGSTIFALPGIKGLAPNGRNADGSLRNTEFTTSSVLTQTLTNETFDARPVILRANVLGFNANASYDDKANTLSTGGYMIVGTGSAVGGKITSLSTKTAFHAVDYSDTDFIAHQAMPSDKYMDFSVLSHGSYYTAPADGYFILALLNGGGVVSSSFGLRNSSNEIGNQTYITSANGSYYVSVPAKKGDKVQGLYYGQDTTKLTVRFIYAVGV